VAGGEPADRARRLRMDRRRGAEALEKMISDAQRVRDRRQRWIHGALEEGKKLVSTTDRLSSHALCS
jgi:hypothetical protein